MSVESESGNKSIDALGKMLQSITALYKQRKEVGDEREIVYHEKNELNKALTCICQLYGLIENETLGLEESIQEALDFIQAAWQYPDETAARITYENNTYATGNFIVETEWKHQAIISIANKEVGKFELFYMEKTPEEFQGILMWERPHMIDAFAAGIALIITRIEAAEKRAALDQVLKQARHTEKKYAAKIARNLPKLKKIKQMADESIQATNLFLASISKELLASSERIVASVGQQDNQESAEDSNWRTIVASSNHISKVVRQIGDFADVETKPFRQNNSEFNLRFLMEDLLGTLYNKSRAKGIDLINFTNAVIPEKLVGDSEKLKQILTNLIDNAINRSSEGEIGVGVELEATPHLLPIFHFTIADSGPPIYEENLVNTFFPFHKEDSDTSSFDIHCRLGRSISKKLVEFMGGEIWVENCFHYEKDNHPGATIHFTMWMDIVSGQNFSGMLANMDVGDVKALVVEKNNVYRRYFRSLLENAGVTPIFTDDYDNALAIIRSRNFDPDEFPIIILRDNFEGLYSNLLVDYLRSDKCEFSLRLIGVSENNVPKDTTDLDPYQTILEKPLSAQNVFNLLQNTIKEFTASLPKEDDEILVANEAEMEPEIESNVESNQKSTAEGPQNTIPRVLMADRADSKRVVIEKLLKKRDCDVSLFSDGRDAIDKIRSGQFDVLIIDIDLPIIGGLEVIKMVREWEKQNDSRISIIGITGENEEMENKMILDAGADECISEPINVKNVLEIIGRLMIQNAEELESESEPEETPTTDRELNLGGVTRFDSDEALSLIDNDSDILIELLEVFADDSKELIDLIDNAISSEKYALVIELGEQMNRAAISVGAKRVSLISNHIIIETGNDNTTQLNSHLELLNEELSAFNREARIFEQSCQQENQKSQK